ncbi:MAG TPA: DUF1475 family protein [Drouetiella sp.]
MIWSLRILFIAIFIVMVIATASASVQCNILAIPGSVTGHPWFVATLADAYCGFLTFYAWLFFKEKSVIGRVIWFIAIMLLGNLAMSAYMLIHLFKLPTDATAEQLLLRN